MSQDLRNRIYDELSSLVLVDPHTHINAVDPGSHTLADILGYHYYTELAHSAGMPRDQIEEPDLDPKEKVARLIANLDAIDNTIQYSWFVEMAQSFFGFDGDRITVDNWEPIYDCAVQEMSADDWPETVLMLSKLEAVFLTNDFDDPLEGFDTHVYIPCLRTDDLVFHLAKPDVRLRLERASGVSVGDADTLRFAIGKLFEHFSSHGARACAISLPPDFEPKRVSPGRANTAIASVYSKGLEAGDADRRAVANFVFWTLAEYCADFQLPFDLMIGVNRGVYEAGVYQGQDLYDSRVSLIQYREFFNAFPSVTFPISVLASVTNQELTSYSWIFPNVVTNGHWWYSNTPTYIEHDAAARLEAVPRTKQIGYYSDMYKLEFALPKFNMYKRILAKILADRFVIDRGWSEERAIEFGQQVLRGNVESIFRLNEQPVVKKVASPESSAPVLAPVETEQAAPDDAFVQQFEAAESVPTELDSSEPAIEFDIDEAFSDAPAEQPEPVAMADTVEHVGDDIVDLEGAFPSPEPEAAEPVPIAAADDEILEDFTMDMDDDMFEEELAPPGVAASVEPVLDDVLDAGEVLETGEDVALSESMIDEFIEDDVLPPGVGAMDESPVQYDEPSIADDDDFPGIKI